jgi:phosphorylcholine metabolism protein LicD
MLIDKTPKQQIFHAKMLEDVKETLDRYNVTSILSGSALLGIIRDGDLIPWSPGVILIVYYSKVKPVENKIKADLIKKGFRLTRHYKKAKNWKIRVDKKKWNVEIVGYDLSDNSKNYYRSSGKRIKIIPAKYFCFLKEIGFKGVIYKCPEDVDGFLTHLYGDWKKPIKSENRSSYKAKTHTRYK